jgi:hypothetical protein
MAPRQKPSDGLGWGLHLHRYHPMPAWPRLLAELVPAEHREGAEAYLRAIAQRTRVARAARRVAQPGTPYYSKRGE